MPLCLIFDLDGTLVDSEGLSMRAFTDLLPDLRLSVLELTHRYRGKKLREVFADIESIVGHELEAEFEKIYRAQVAVLFEQELKAIEGVHAMLDALPFPRCIASSGPPVKIAQALQITGLAPYFGDRIFSSHDIQSWKPDPGLFLHAAAAMGFKPRDCVVIEDSEVGVEAAIAAGMRVFRYLPELAVDTGSRCTAFSRMSELPLLIAEQ
ncbi:MAG TPA: HAD-IA family hydrolase [Steroidobacteraceae bacterium]|nr:HAD-IA family hydrolase [Steroidobacteraceae bacterium]